jgi:hypothetical protein
MHLCEGDSAAMEAEHVVGRRRYARQHAHLCIVFHLENDKLKSLLGSIGQCKVYFVVFSIMIRASYLFHCK